MTPTLTETLLTVDGIHAPSSKPGRHGDIFSRRQNHLRPPIGAASKGAARPA
jgi:hypothetical protein